MEPINIRLPEKKLEKIDEIASKNGITRSLKGILRRTFQRMRQVSGSRPSVSFLKAI
ncbi:MAG: type II toxin-antitoxin system HicB family antitoxin [Candidatus Syntrophoarchaeum sp.]|nr:type II toxin-antitoxin system HicB family antitoxin [Candidatus Syntrophoarchaeum sp.]